MDTLSSAVISSFNSVLHHMTGHTRRSYAAELATAYFADSARKTEQVLGISRTMTERGLQKARTGIRCLENFSQRGRKKNKPLSAS